MSEEQNDKIEINLDGNVISIWDLKVEEDEHGSFISFECDSEDEKEQENIKSLLLEAIESYSAENIPDEEE